MDMFGIVWLSYKKYVTQKSHGNVWNYLEMFENVQNCFENDWKYSRNGKKWDTFILLAASQYVYNKYIIIYVLSIPKNTFLHIQQVKST